MAMITAISWIPKGVSKSEPSAADPLSKDDIQQLFVNLNLNLDASGESENYDDNDDGVPHAIGNSSTEEKCEEDDDDVTLALKDLHMEHYDDEDDGVPLFTSDLYYPSNHMDPYIKDQNDDDDSEELASEIIYPTDCVIVCAGCGENKHDSFLEVWILEDGEVEPYNRHPIMIPAFPLCTAWLDSPLQGGQRGNFLAVGSMEPSIEIWNLDVVGEVQPCVELGGIAEKKRKGKRKSIRYKDGSHTGSVLGLAWNKKYRNKLASASADKRVKIWDVVAGKCDITMEHHSDKVQAVAWNQYAPQVLLSGSFDRTVVLKDCRMPSHSGYRWSVTADVESMAWDPHTEHSFVVSLEDGIVKCFDVRTALSDSTSELSSTFTLHAHDEAVTSVSYNLSAHNLLATGSTDKMVKLWDLSNNQPSCVASQTVKVGPVFSISFSEDNPFLLAIGGAEKEFQVWDTLSDPAISQRYWNYNKNKPQSGA